MFVAEGDAAPISFVPPLESSRIYACVIRQVMSVKIVLSVHEEDIVSRPITSRDIPNDCGFRQTLRLLLHRFYVRGVYTASPGLVLEVVV